ncbi:MAG: membrane protein insertase YidC [Pseudomonadota bacterium]
MQEAPKTNIKNVIMAMVLSMAVLIGWQVIFIQPKLEAEQAALIAAEEQALRDQAAGISPSGTGADASGISATGAAGSVDSTTLGGPVVVGDAALPFDREAALAAGERVAIDTPSLRGSINLLGAKVDDLLLKNYNVTVDEDSDNVFLLHPRGTKDPYFAEFGYVGAGLTDLPGSNTQWTLQQGDTLTPTSPITLGYTSPQGIEFQRTISIDEDYLLTFSDAVVNGSNDAISLQSYGRISRSGVPETEGIFILHEGLLGMFGEEGFITADYGDGPDDPLVTTQETVTDGWLGMTDKYWGTALIPTVGTEFTPSYRYFNQSGPRFQTDYLTTPQVLAAGAAIEVQANLFAGAKVTSIIDRYDEQLGVQSFDLMIDWGWFYFITKPLFKMISWFNALVGNFGVAILLSTLVIKAALFWFANKSYASMARMKVVQPKLMELRELHKDDKMAQQQAMMQLYKDEKINPAAGCWPVLIQIPVFFALYKVLYITIEMRHAPFFGWINDLSVPDPTSIFNLFGLLPFEVGGFLLVGIWPILMGITMFLQMRMNPTPPDPTQQMIFTWMPVVFTFMLATFPAGLVIYWTWNNFLSILQQGVIMKRNGAKIELFDNLKNMFSRKPKEDPAE